MTGHLHIILSKPMITKIPVKATFLYSDLTVLVN